MIEPVNEDICKDEILKNIDEVADVFAFADDQLLTLAAAGVITPLKDADQIREENYESTVQAASINEKLYAYPMTADNGYYMYYNKKYFSEEDVKTFDGMLQAAGKADKKVAMDWSSGWYLYSFFGNTGLTLNLNDDMITNTCNWNSKEGDIKGVDVATAMSAIARNKAFTNVSDDGFLAGVSDGSIVAGVSGMWNAVHLQKAWGDHYGAVKLPTYTVNGKQVQMASYAGYKMIGVNAYSKEYIWADRLARFITNEKNQMLRFKQRQQGPSNKVAGESEEVKASIAIQALMSQLQYSQLQRVGETYWLPARNLGIALAEGNLSPDEMQKALDKMVQENSGIAVQLKEEAAIFKQI